MAWKSFRYKWQWLLKSSPQELWPYVADTQRFNQAVHLPLVDFTEIPLETGGSRQIGHLTRFGIVIEWEEYPFDWVREQDFSVLRRYTRGPIAQLWVKLILEPEGPGTRLTYQVEATPAGWLGVPAILYQLSWSARRYVDRVFRQIDQGLQQKIEQPLPLPVTPVSRAGMARLAEFGQQLVASGHEPRWVERLVELVANEPDLNVVRLRPYRLANAWQAPRLAILEMFLSAAKLGLLTLRWDVLCPLCRGASTGVTSLAGISRQVHCSTCNIDYEAGFSRNVELTFNPHPQIRAVHDEHSYCVGGPMLTPHILLHQGLQPDETRPLSIKLEPGQYRIRTQRPEVEAWVMLEDARLVQLSICAGADTLEARLEPLAGQNTAVMGQGMVNLRLTNKAPYPQRIFIERADWYTDTVTAAEVTTLQHFRNLFSDEVLRPGEEIGVQGMTVLFSDLVGSTAMYNRRGDAPSYALVRNQFDFLERIVRAHEGAIVKTIGDAVMAAFVDPARGVAAALAIQNEVAAFNESLGDEMLTIKLGLHHGPCIAVNLNGRLDYFGATVNLAARLEGQSRGGDVVISEWLWQDPGVQALLASLPVEATRYETSIKGFDDRFALYRLQLLDILDPTAAKTALSSRSHGASPSSSATALSISSPK